MLDLREETFVIIDHLLSEVWSDNLTGDSAECDPPSQEHECLAVAAINILKLQLHSCLARDQPIPEYLWHGSPLLTSLREKISELAANAGVVSTVQEAAQQCLQVSWVILMPRAEERAKALSALLPTVTSSENAGEGAHSGKRFMTNLLVSSLMEESELKSALLTAIKVEVSTIQHYGLDLTVSKFF